MPKDVPLWQQHRQPEPIQFDGEVPGLWTILGLVGTPLICLILAYLLYG